MLIFITYIYMALDPILYLNASKTISPIWPILTVSGVVITFASVILPFILKPADSKSVEFIFRIIKKLKNCSTDIASQLFLGAASALLLILFAIYYQDKIYVHGVAGIFDAELIEPPLEGFGGVYLVSWCAIPILLNVIFCFLSLAHRGIVASIRNRDKETEGLTKGV